MSGQKELHSFPLGLIEPKSQTPLEAGAPSDRRQFTRLSPERSPVTLRSEAVVRSSHRSP